MSQLMLMEDKAIEQQLQQAQAALLAPNFRLAQRYLQNLLSIPSPLVDLEEKVRHLVKQCSEQMLPNWDLAEQTLSILDALHLKDRKTQEWQYSLKLQQARKYLKDARDLDFAMSLFEEIKSEHCWQEFGEQIDRDIARVFRETLSEWVNQGDWIRAHQLIRIVHERWPVNDEIYDWLGVFASVLARAAEAPNEVGRYRAISQSLSMIFAIAAILYTLVLVF